MAGRPAGVRSRGYRLDQPPRDTLLSMGFVAIERSGDVVQFSLRVCWNGEELLDEDGQPIRAFFEGMEFTNWMIAGWRYLPRRRGPKGRRGPAGEASGGRNPEGVTGASDGSS